MTYSASPSSFAELLISVPPRERSGPRSSNRFSFQHSWGLALVLTLHDKAGDYCVLFDVHDDVVALDHPLSPTAADVYQVKSKTAGTWTSHNLTTREANESGGQKPSILGNLYGNYVRFPSFIRTLSFITNAHFNIKMTSPPPCTERDSFCVTEIEHEEQADVNSKIAAEHNVPSPPTGLGLTYLVRTSLSLLDHEKHTEGIVSEFLQRHGDGTILPGPFHRTMRSEVRRRSDKEYVATSFAALTKQKGLSRSDLQGMLDAIPTERRMDALATTIRSQLIQENFNVRQQGILNADVRNYLAKRLDETNTVLVKARKRAAIEVAALPDAVFVSATPVANILSLVAPLQAKEFDAIRRDYSDTFLHAIIAVAIYEHHELSSTSPQPPEKSP